MKINKAGLEKMANSVKLPDAILYLIGDGYHLQACSSLAKDLLGDWRLQVYEEDLEKTLNDFDRVGLWVRISSLPNL